MFDVFSIIFSRLFTSTSLSLLWQKTRCVPLLAVLVMPCLVLSHILIILSVQADSRSRCFRCCFFLFFRSCRSCRRLSSSFACSSALARSRPSNFAIERSSLAVSLSIPDVSYGFCARKTAALLVRDWTGGKDVHDGRIFESPVAILARRGAMVFLDFYSIWAWEREIQWVRSRWQRI